MAVVTGAASGIGAATADLLTGAGVRVLSLDRAFADDHQAGASSRTEVVVDVTDREAVRERLARALEDDSLTYVVNCAGVLPANGFADVPDSAWRHALDVNLIGAYHVMDAAGAHLASAPMAAVVNVTSLEADRVVALSNPDPNPQYAASKAALRMLTKSAARALAASGTRVNSVSPGFVRTPMAAQHGAGPSLPPGLADRVPLGRFAEAGEVAHAIAFLLSDQASYITGSDLRIDGGFELT
ncbi:MAG TPA: SDR family oxidoreductase [Gemmatimonadales bacterium]|nr:SDR family oxidoreductase [Gemmatimonadales bacterium]